MSLRPREIILGTERYWDVAQERRVFTPMSPNFSLSGAAPQPQESNTIKNTRFMLLYFPSILTAVSRATFIMVVKAVWRSSEVVSSPVSM